MYIALDGIPRFRRSLLRVLQHARRDSAFFAKGFVAPFVESSAMSKDWCPSGVVLRALLEGTRAHAPLGDTKYLDVAARVIESGPLSERIRAGARSPADKQRYTGCV